MPILISIFVVATSFILTWIIRRYALNKNILDIPNSRSSHTVPTPRGGGVAIAVASLAGIALFCSFTPTTWKLCIGMSIAGTLITLIGFFDDKGHISPKWRLLTHLIAAGIIVFSTGTLPPIQFFGHSIDFGYLGYILAIISSIWILNLFNFMDGLDGLASIEALYFFLIMGALSTNFMPAISTISTLLACATFGFLLWNFPPAKIFMGDAGSGFLGIMIAATLLGSYKGNPSLLWSGLILLGVFVVDATVTLLTRLLAKKKVFEAHRSHAYQHLSVYTKSHRVVTLGILVVNILWLTPLAVAAGLNYIDGFFALIIAYTPLLYVSLKLKAGIDT